MNIGDKISVTNPNSEYYGESGEVTGLTPAMVRITLDNGGSTMLSKTSVTVITLEQQQHPTVTVLDTSGSMPQDVLDRELALIDGPFLSFTTEILEHDDPKTAEFQSGGTGDLVLILKEAVERIQSNPKKYGHSPVIRFVTDGYAMIGGNNPLDNHSASEREAANLKSRLRKELEEQQGLYSTLCNLEVENAELRAALARLHHEAVAESLKKDIEGLDSE